MNLFANLVHAGNRVLHRSHAFFSRRQRLPRNVGRLLRAGRHLIDVARHFQHRITGLPNLGRLLLLRGQQLRRCLLSALGCARHLCRRLIDPQHDVAQFLNREVHRVGDGAGDVLGHGRMHRQVTVGHLGQFVHQPQNSRLITRVQLLRRVFLLLGFLLTHACFLLTHARFLFTRALVGTIDLEQQKNYTCQQQTEREHQVKIVLTAIEFLLVGACQLDQRIFEFLVIVKDVLCRLLGIHQPLHVAQDARYGSLISGKRLFHFAEALFGICICGCVQAQ